MSLIIASLSLAGVISLPLMLYPRKDTSVFMRLHLAAANFTPNCAILAKTIPSARMCSSLVTVKINKSSQYTFTNGKPQSIIDMALNNAEDECCAPMIILKNFHLPVKHSPLEATLLPHSAKNAVGSVVSGSYIMLKNAPCISIVEKYWAPEACTSAKI